MDWFAALLLLVHYSLLSLLCIFGAHRFFVTYSSRRHYRQPVPAKQFTSYPKVTVQLPLYNEQFVAQRAIAALGNLDYPSSQLEIQVLDDSTDNTSDIVAECVAQLNAKGIRAEHIRRTNRSGFKAGALAAALPQASGEFIAVFDADFVPDPGLLKQLVHYFTDPQVGMVQAQWDYLNRQQNFLTRLQGILLDAHFCIEQTSRFANRVFFNFNGTAGMWRRQTIIDAGGWQADTITEDLDLSYRAQLRGWQFIYLRDVRCKSELPATMQAFKSQQHRWTKGGIEVMLKLTRQIWRSPIRLKTKLEATLHLASNLSHLIILIDSLFFLIPAIMLRQDILPYPPLWVDMLLFLLGGISHLYFYLAAQASLKRPLWPQCWLVPALMATSIGMSNNNGRGVWEALIGRRTPFVRTPKQGDSAPPRKYLAALKQNSGLLEAGVGCVYLLVCLWCIQHSVWMALPFMLLFGCGFLFTGGSSLLKS